MSWSLTQGMNYPSYITLNQSGELEERIDRAYNLLESCTVCPRKCRVNRLDDERGFCRTGLLPVISSSGPHFGEEPPLVGFNGSGTIFITHCNLACQFCQNYDISQCGNGEPVSCEKLAGIMICLQKQGCHNINLVTPTHIVPQILKSLKIAIQEGLRIPVVYNSGGYDAVDTLRLLDGIVDIYMPDAKYGSDDIAIALSHAPDYVAIMKAGITEMHRQVGDLVIDKKGIAMHGMIIRHLVLPENLAGSDSVLPWIAQEISRDSYVNIMNQYHPSWHTSSNRKSLLPPSLCRRITSNEYHFAIQCALESGLHRGFCESNSTLR
ncbi:MAG: radical SAM protein [Methanoregula sp.]|nr:radical SAM protein [Methanoregula sp.]